MIKKIIVKLCKDNTVELSCNGIIKKVEKNTISALAIYELLNYQDGDTYSVEECIEGTKKDIVDPIKLLLDNIKNQIDALPSVLSQIEDDIKKIEESSKD